MHAFLPCLRKRVVGFLHEINSSNQGVPEPSHGNNQRFNVFNVSTDPSSAITIPIPTLNNFANDAISSWLNEGLSLNIRNSTCGQQWIFQG